MEKSAMKMARIDRNERLTVDQLDELVGYLRTLQESGRPLRSSSAHPKRERSEAQRSLDEALAGEIKRHLWIHVENGLVNLGDAPRTTQAVKDGVREAIQVNPTMNADRYYDYARAVIMAEGRVDPAIRAESKKEGAHLSLDWLDNEYPEIMKKADARYERHGAEVAKDIEAILSGKSKVQDR